jgi:hypothetical protein
MKKDLQHTSPKALQTPTSALPIAWVSQQTLWYRTSPELSGGHREMNLQHPPTPLLQNEADLQQINSDSQHHKGAMLQNILYLLRAQTGEAVLKEGVLHISRGERLPS